MDYFKLPYNYVLISSVIVACIVLLQLFSICILYVTGMFYTDEEES